VTSRRTFLVTFAGGILAVPLAAEAQQAGRLPTIGYVSPAVAGPNALVDAFNRGLREAGFVEGRNIVVDRRHMGSREDQYDQVMAQLEQQKVDVIVAAGPPAALAAKRVVKTVPVVFAGVGDPVVIGLVQSLARPGGNLTGVAFDVTPEIAGKRLELLKAAVPTLSRVAALWSSADPVGLPQFRQLEQAAQRVRVKVIPYDVRGPESFDPLFDEILKDRANGMLVVGGPVNVIHQKRIIAFASTHRLPAVSISRSYVEDGGLMSYGPSFADIMQHAAGYVARILKGAKPGDLPIEQPTKFELVINLKTAKALGLTIPRSLLVRADQVIQ
jgi:putative ABC transport system substrate-binding protein